MSSPDVQIHHSCTVRCPFLKVPLWHRASFCWRCRSVYGGSQRRRSLSVLLSPQPELTVKRPRLWKQLEPPRRTFQHEKEIFPHTRYEMEKNDPFFSLNA